jgi:hypothetical protein
MQQPPAASQAALLAPPMLGLISGLRASGTFAGAEMAGMEKGVASPRLNFVEAYRLALSRPEA